MALMLYLDDAMKVLLQNDFIKDGYIDDDGGSEVVRNELEQKCYLREPVDIVRCKDCKNNNQCSIQFKFADADNPDNWFCAYGKRKEGR